MEQVLIGIILAVIGLVVCFFGLRFWFYLLPIFGAVAGFFIGARVVQDLFGNGFLSTATSWVVGIVLAIIFAALSWFIWYFGVIIQAGAVGATLASGIVHAVSSNPWGIVLLVAAVIGAVVFAIGALALNLPIYIIIINSALAGASLAVAGVLMLLGTVTVNEIADGASVAVVDEARFQGASWLWLLAWLVLVILGVVYQLRAMNAIQLPEQKWIQAQAA
jgi:hypothetical protein